MCNHCKDPRFNDVVYMVEATHFEHFMLWKENSERQAPMVPLRWEQDTLGHIYTIGELAGNPIAVSVEFAVIDGRRVAFYEATSQVVDHRLVEKWIKEQCPAGTQHCDGMNFAHCVAHITGMNRSVE